LIVAMPGSFGKDFKNGRTKNVNSEL